jgi:hypothetical protein
MAVVPEALQRTRSTPHEPGSHVRVAAVLFDREEEGPLAPIGFRHAGLKLGHLTIARLDLVIRATPQAATGHRLFADVLSNQRPHRIALQHRHTALRRQGHGEQHLGQEGGTAREHDSLPPSATSCFGNRTRVAATRTDVSGHVQPDTTRTTLSTRSRNTATQVNAHHRRDETGCGTALGVPGNLEAQHPSERRRPGSQAPGSCHSGHSRPAHHRVRFNHSRDVSGLSAPVRPGGLPCASISRSSRFPEAPWRRSPVTPRASSARRAPPRSLPPQLDLLLWWRALSLHSRWSRSPRGVKRKSAAKVLRDVTAPPTCRRRAAAATAPPSPSSP